MEKIFFYLILITELNNINLWPFFSNLYQKEYFGDKTLGTIVYYVNRKSYYRPHVRVTINSWAQGIYFVKTTRARPFRLCSPSSRQVWGKWRNEVGRVSPQS